MIVDPATVPHVLVAELQSEGYVAWSVECPHTGIDKPCATWVEKPSGNDCVCKCSACVAGNHDDCDSEWIAEVGRKYCQTVPTEQCWYDHALREVGAEMLDIKGHLTARFPVHLKGFSWDDPIEATPA